MRAPIDLSVIKEMQSLNEQVSISYEKGRFNEAIEAAKRLRSLLEEQLGTRDPNYAASVSSLAWLYQETGQYDAAEPLHFEALRIRRDMLGKDHPDVALTLRNLAQLYLTRRRYNKAKRCVRKALAIIKASQHRN